MSIIVRCKSNVCDGDLIALTKDGRFFGYGSVMAALDGYIMLDVGKNELRTFNELFGEDIPYDFVIE